jgi:DNA-binding transcriptional LysR family regulator
LNIRELQYFVVSADMGSFKSAAEMLYTTQSHVSKSVKSLEDELGLILFSRKFNGVVLTPAGRHIYSCASQALSNIDSISIQQEDSKKRKLYISASPSVSMASIFAEFIALNYDDDMLFSFSEETIENVMCHLHDQLSEIGFVYISDRQMIRFEEELRLMWLEFVPMAKSEPVLLVGEHHPQYGASEVDYTTVKTMKFVQMKEDYYSLNNHPGHLKNDFLGFDYSQKAVITNSMESVFRMLENTSLCYIDCDVFRRLNKYHVYEIPIANIKNCVSFGYIKRMDTQLSPLTQDFIHYLENEITKSGSKIPPSDA